MAYPLFHERGPADVPMVMSPQEVRDAFPEESGLVEFKQGLPELKLREAVTAFSNSDGGVILLGVRDDGAVQGLAITGDTEAKVHRMVAGVRDAGRYSLHRVAVGSTDLLVLSVQRRREGFAQLQDGRVLVRRGAMNMPLFGQQLTTFLAARALSRFESTTTRLVAEQADHDRLEKLRAACAWSSADLGRRLEEAGLVASGDNGPALTVAGVLCLTPQPEEALGKAYIEIFRYRGSATYDKRLQIVGSVDHQVEEAVRLVLDELGADVVVLGLRRYELPRLPEAVLRESLANAVAHRSYEISTQSVRVEIWPDRVVIRSPGGLPEPVTLDNIREQNAARNLDLIKVLRRYRLAEDAGLGVDVIEDTMEAALLERPRFDSDGTYVSVTLPLGSTVTPRERAWISEVERRGEIRADDRVILLHAARGKILTNASVRDLLTVDSTHARAALVRLRDLGYLVQHGERGGASYTVAKELGPPAGLQLDREQLGDVVLALVDEKTLVTNEAVRERTGLDRARTLNLLTGMVEDGQLVRHGERRGAYYSRPAAP